MNERNYYFYFARKSRAPAKVSWCLDNLCLANAPPTLHNVVPHVDSSKRFAWKGGSKEVTWRQVAEHDWLCEDNLRVVMKGGQTFSIRGALGACHGKAPNEGVFQIMSRLCSN